MCEYQHIGFPSRIDGAAIGGFSDGWHVEVSVFKIHPVTGERPGNACEGDRGRRGWVDLGEPIIVRAGEAFIAVPEKS